MIDTSLRAVDSILRDGSEVEIHEKHTWSELRTRYKAGNRKEFSRQITSIGIVEDSTASFPLRHPETTPEGGIKFVVPSIIEKIRVNNRSGRSTRDMGESYPEGQTHLAFRRLNDGSGEMDVPAIAVKRAKS